ncbi:gamma-glutamyltransferase [Cocleimonas flava]|uniref:Glutathione hydrolase proenzyme n=1 Tax=Cocleimonas flava TaxID=634765 RepID=A0A4R1EV53_9GAMM|nr:gamma-glutamyltransferase [Cocleimonas flava]TCJ85153.1 gamma-glutamyltransferase 1 [Cocleimonas flava]
MIIRTRFKFFVFSFYTLLFSALFSLLLSSPPAFADLPEAVTTKKEMVVTTNPLATAAGEKILRNGGTAADAMVAVQTVLGLVEPQSSGLGGGAFVVYYDARKGKLTTFDAREKAPASATGDRFAGLGFVEAWQSGLSVGVPGTPRMMEYVHDKYGRLPWRKLFKPAIKLAQKGYPLTGRTSEQVQGLLSRNAACDDRLYFRDPTAFEYFANADCTAKAEGTMMFNQPYADTLKKLRKKGADGFYSGDIAEAIAAATQGDLAIAGDMTVEDLANYNVVEREPVCLDYRGHNVCGMGPPSSGALAVGQILGILENFDVSGDPLAVENVHLFTQAGRLAFADRGKYVADSDFVEVPVDGMLNKDYLATRAALIDPEMDMGTASPGVPPGVIELAAADVTAKNSGTSHVSIVDQWGNALSMTTTIESSFGNGVMVHGFLLNNELTDFSFSAEDSEGVPIANRVEANKRPRSSMSPTIVFDEDGRLEIVTGSPGGSRIIGYTAQSIMNIIDFGLDPQEAINVPHYMNRNGRTDVEIPIVDVTLDYDAEALALSLKELGHSDPGVPLEDRSVGVIAQTSGLSIIQVVRKSRGHGHHHNNYGDEEEEEVYDEVMQEVIDEVDELVETEELPEDTLTDNVSAKVSAKGASKNRGKHDYSKRHWRNHYRTTLVGGGDYRRDGTVGGR